MKRIVMLGLFVVLAGTAHADHVWRLWCGTPATPRQGAYDTSQKCNQQVNMMGSDVQTYCRDTKNGPRWSDGDRIRAWDAYATCAAISAEQRTCHCSPEAVN